MRQKGAVQATFIVLALLAILVIATPIPDFLLGSLGIKPSALITAVYENAKVTEPAWNVRRVAGDILIPFTVTGPVRLHGWIAPDGDHSRAYKFYENTIIRPCPENEPQCGRLSFDITTPALTRGSYKLVVYCTECGSNPCPPDPTVSRAHGSDFYLLKQPYSVPDCLGSVAVGPQVDFSVQPVQLAEGIPLLDPPASLSRWRYQAPEFTYEYALRTWRLACSKRAASAAKLDLGATTHFGVLDGGVLVSAASYTNQRLGELSGNPFFGSYGKGPAEFIVIEATNAIPSCPPIPATAPPQLSAPTSKSLLARLLDFIKSIFNRIGALSITAPSHLRVGEAGTFQASTSLPEQPDLDWYDGTRSVLHGGCFIAKPDGSIVAEQPFVEIPAGRTAFDCGISGVQGLPVGRYAFVLVLTKTAQTYNPDTNSWITGETAIIVKEAQDFQTVPGSAPSIIPRPSAKNFLAAIIDLIRRIFGL